jgi:hypothetical protein
MRRWINRFLLLACLALLGLGGNLLWYANQPMQVAGALYPIDFSIHRGAALSTASQSLQQSGVLTRPGHSSCWRG